MRPMLWPWCTIGRMSRHLSPSRRMIATSAGSACGSLTLTVMLSWSSIARRAMGNWLSVYFMVSWRRLPTSSYSACTVTVRVVGS